MWLTAISPINRKELEARHQNPGMRAKCDWETRTEGPFINYAVAKIPARGQRKESKRDEFAPRHLILQMYVPSPANLHLTSGLFRPSTPDRGPSHPLRPIPRGRVGFQGMMMRAASRTSSRATTPASIVLDRHLLTRFRTRGTKGRGLSNT